MLARAPKVSILLPTFNGSGTIRATLMSILRQSESNFEVIVSDDASTDDTPNVASQIGDPRIQVFRHNENVGYPGNLQRAFDRARGEIVFLMGQDDLLHSESLTSTITPFSDPQVMAVTRPYFWFRGSVTKVDRVKKPIAAVDVALDLHSDPDLIAQMFRMCDQLSGLAIRRAAIKIPFHADVFPCHVYPFTSAFQSGKVVCLANYTVAVRTESSQSRSVSSIYDKSPMRSWLDWLDASFSGDQHTELRKRLRRNFIGDNAVGLLQIRCYSSKPIRFTVREIAELVSSRPANLRSFRFWAVSVACMVLPRGILRRLTDGARAHIVGPGRAHLVSPAQMNRFLAAESPGSQD